jgi:sugar O-acyltransferase (sialic acid O-acetyltransferase NeuD family)
MKNKIIIVGAFHEIIELAEISGCEVFGLIDNKKTNKYRTYRILCNDSEAIERSSEFKEYPILLTPDIPSTRKKLFKFYSNESYIFFTLISPKAEVSISAKIGLGSVIQSGVNISSEVEIGEFVKVNSNVNIMHNSLIGNFTTIAPNAVVLGNVKIGDNCYVGANSTILPNLQVCSNVVIGAGAVLTKNILKKGIYIGNPARELIK